MRWVALLAVQDQNASQHDLAGDPEGRPTRLSYPNTVQDSTVTTLWGNC
ncbi:MAG: hypothetical protein U0931_40080 [Vulcanimicrobiota bacterium]